MVRKPIADPYGLFPERRPTLHEHCMRHQFCTGQGCRAKGRKWPRKSQGSKRIVKPTADMVRPPMPISHRVIDILPAAQVIALWEFRQALLGGENAISVPPQAEADSTVTNA